MEGNASAHDHPRPPLPCASVPACEPGITLHGRRPASLEPFCCVVDAATSVCAAAYMVHDQAVVNGKRPLLPWSQGTNGPGTQAWHIQRLGLGKRSGCLAMPTLGYRSHEAPTTPQPQSWEERGPVQLQLFGAQSFRAREYQYFLCRGTDHLQMLALRIRPCLTVLAHPSGQAPQGHLHPRNKTYVSPTKHCHCMSCYPFAFDPATPSTSNQARQSPFHRNLASAAHTTYHTICTYSSRSRGHHPYCATPVPVPHHRFVGYYNLDILQPPPTGHSPQTLDTLKRRSKPLPTDRQDSRSYTSASYNPSTRRLRTLTESSGQSFHPAKTALHQP
ncbi:uncharacterized protein EKO05_0009633 [Ascochyta rabiei]|uniref:uncharacterized protein n=1 Tax=Didymella rabiei TaxID=5454 RepID=UPI0021FD6F66|nr:uncharacterized protein EKO05_0009633 [Ascochyta rabiei]UPX19366.1 hypothetical protein EKO05_0009633 [Ascochyta rabiei]